MDLLERLRYRISCKSIDHFDIVNKWNYPDEVATKSIRLCTYKYGCLCRLRSRLSVLHGSVLRSYFAAYDTTKCDDFSELFNGCPQSLEIKFLQISHYLPVTITKRYVMNVSYDCKRLYTLRIRCVFTINVLERNTTYRIEYARGAMTWVSHIWPGLSHISR